MRSVRFARFLVRLYPAAWRARYGDEIVALVEQTGLDFFRAFDLCRGALREWQRDLARPLAERPRSSAALLFMVRTAASAAAMSGLATAVAVWLSEHASSPRIMMEDGHRLIAPPLLPSRLAYSFFIVFGLVMLRTGSLTRVLQGPSRSGLPPLRVIRPREFAGWVVAICLTSVAFQWLFLVCMIGTGFPSFTPASTWGMSFVMTAWMLLVLCHGGFEAGRRTADPSLPA